MACAINYNTHLHNGVPFDVTFSTTTREPDQVDDETLESILESQPYLYDLHTHLLGMGNTGLWIDSIIENDHILPTHNDFCKKPKLRVQLCPLIWNNRKANNGSFIDGKKTAMFFDYLIQKNYPQSKVNDILDCLRGFEDDEIRKFSQLIENTKFCGELKHYNLSFGQSNNNDQTRSNEGEPLTHNIKGDFTYDVVLTLSDLSKSLGINIPWMTELEDLIQSKVEEKLGLHIYRQSSESSVQRADQPFRRWIIFNAREQCFQVVKGITVETLRKYIAIEPNAPAQKCTLARAHIQNAFSMRNPDGTDPRPIDFDRFHGSFTPEFYPRRFALKDSLYSQRLDILAVLLVYVLRRYQACQPPIRYCELSIGVGDICRPWVFSVLCSFPPYEDIMNAKINFQQPSSFRKMIQSGYFRHLRNACPKPDEKNKQNLSCVPNVTYKFLAGFNRQAVIEHRLNNQVEAFHLLNDSPDVAIHYMLEQIAKSEEDEAFDKKIRTSQVSTEEPRDTLFSKALADLKKLQEAAAKNSHFYYWVVGLDLFGDELGYPYCPFVAWPFIRYIRERREKNEKFGLRIHCGENVPFADVDAGAYRHFIAHMYIVFRCLRFLQRKLMKGIRIGHGVAFARMLSIQTSKSMHRKSSVLLAEMQDHAKALLTKFIFEINITSNEYLLGQALRQGDHEQPIRLDALTELDVPIILATDDDGIWPIDHCPSRHPGHHSLVAEYCRAFSSKLIALTEELQKILKNTKESCFYSSNGECILPDYSGMHGILPKHDKYASTIIFHPNLIKDLLSQYYGKQQENTDLYQYYSKLYPQNRRGYDNSDGMWKCLTPFVFMHYYFIEKEANLNDYKNEYDCVFDNSPPFEDIYESWLNIWTRFMYPMDTTTSNHIDANKNKLIFLSESSHHNQQELSYLIDGLNRSHFRQHHVYVFTREVSKPVEMVQMLNQILQKDHPAKSIKIFTTKNKDVYIDSTGMESRQVMINKNPLQRTNHYNIQEKHALYVICRHGSAATAYLHYIGHTIKMSKGLNWTDSSTQRSVAPNDQSNVSTVCLSPNISVQSNDTS